MSVTPRGMSVQEAYREFRSENFKVNRIYQRKLVWTREEKKKLIDSILQGYPIPLFLLARTDEKEGSIKYEILDGLQRFDAIFSYIENKFSLEGEYFDVKQLSRANNLAKDGVFEAVRDEDNILPPSECANILDYQLAVTIFPSEEERDINEVFSRINSYGRNLSSQDKRQAGVVSPFANLIRTLAADIRGDSSPERLDLSEMAEISIDISEEGQDYGIKADETFWCREGIMRKRHLRDSHDEQFLADVIVSVLSDEPFPYSRKKMDEVYESETDRYKEVEESLSLYGVDKLENDIWSTYQEIKKVFEKHKYERNVRDIVNPGSSNPVKTDFYAIFMAFYYMVIKRDKIPADPNKIVESLEGIHESLKFARGSKSKSSRRKNIDTVKGRIQDHFVKADDPVSGVGKELERNLERVLQRSRIESNIYECKQGIVSLDHERSVEESFEGKIPATICGIANVNSESEGALIFGVADSSLDAKRVEDLDGVQSIKVGDRFVVGVDREATLLDLSLEEYERRIIKTIRKSELSEPLKSEVLSNIQTFDYRGLHVTYVRIPKQDELSRVSDSVFVREGSSTERVDNLDKIFDLRDRFD